MGRMNAPKAAALAALTLCLSSMLVTCDNSIDLKSDLTVEVKKSNDRYLRVIDIDVPLNNENQFSPTGTIGIYFDRDIDPQTVNENTVVIRKTDGTAVSYPQKGIDYVSSARLVRIRVYDYLPVDTDFSISVIGVRGSDGSVILEKASTTFHTQNILAGSILSLSSASEINPGFSTTPTVSLACKVNDLYQQIKWRLSLNYETSDEPDWTDYSTIDYLDYAAMSPSGTFNIENFDLAASGLSGYGEGPLRVTVQFLGRNNGTTTWSEGLTDTTDLFLDLTSPLAGSLSVNGGDTWTTEELVSLTLSGASDGDAGSGIEGISFSNDGTTWSVFDTPADSVPWNLTTGAGGTADNGMKTLYARVRDQAGNISESIFASIGYDNVKPEAGTWSINGGASVTNSNTVNIIAGILPSDANSGAAYMQFSNDASQWSDWETVGTSKVWDIVSGPGGSATEGSRSVYVRVRDWAGNVSEAVSDSIEYDATPPAVSTPDLVSADDTGVSNADNITNMTSGLTFSGTADPDVTIELIEGGVTLGSTVTDSLGAWTMDISLTEGTHTLIARATDSGLSSDSFPLDITVDTTLPVAPVTGASETITTRIPSWSWNSGGGGCGIFLYTCSVLGASNTETTASGIAAATALADGAYALTVREMDLAGNLSSQTTQTITVNALPGTPVVSLYNTDAITLTTSATWTWTSGGFGKGYYRYQLDSTSGAWAYTTGNSVTFSSLSDTSHTLYVEEQDAGGEWSADGVRSVRVTPVIPYNGQTKVSRTPLMEWRSTFLATYTLFVQNPDTGVFMEVWSGTTPHYQVQTALPTLTTINWKVAVTTKLGTSYMPTKGYYSFTTNLR